MAGVGTMRTAKESEWSQPSARIHPFRRTTNARKVHPSVGLFFVVDLEVFESPLSAKSGQSRHLIAGSACIKKCARSLPRYLATAPDPIRASPVPLDRA